jgi:hypothetical protein
MPDEMTRAEFAEYMSAFEKRLETRFGGLEQKMRMGFEETRGDIRLAFEGLVAVQESMDRKLENVQADLVNQTSLIHAVLRNLRGRVDNLEQR